MYVGSVNDIGWRLNSLCFGWTFFAFGGDTLEEEGSRMFHEL